MHTYLALRVDLIPNETKNGVKTFWYGRFNIDKTLMLIDGKNENGDLVHPQSTLYKWLYWSENKDEIIQELLSTAVEYTKDEIAALSADPESEWYEDESA